MTTLNVFRVVSVEERRLTLHTDHTYGWDWDGLVSSRTMALQILWDSLTPAALLWPEFEGWDGHEESWNLANVGRFVSCVGVVDRQHHYEMWNDSRHEYWDGRGREALPVPQATYLIAVTDPRWLVHLTPGMYWDSTAYDHDANMRFDPVWRTSDVLALARGIDTDLAFDRMPILADALQEAGCDSDDLLSHLRDTSATHVRGCWALDLVLGKE